MDFLSEYFATHVEHPGIAESVHLPRIGPLPYGWVRLEASPDTSPDDILLSRGSLENES